MAIAIVAAASSGRRRSRAVTAIGFAAAFCVLSGLLSIAVGPIRIAPAEIVRIFVDAATGATDRGRDAVVILDLRLPRTLLGMLVGAATATAGAVLQGLFRNPLADPSLVGVSSGAALAAAAWFVLGAGLARALPGALAALGLPLAAFLGGLAVTAALQLIATREGRTSVVTLLLAGIALTGMASALTGLLIFVASDQQLREFTFWTLGSLGGATFAKIGMVLPFVLVLLITAPALARGLDAIALGENEAFHLGVSVERLKRVAVLCIAAAIGASVAVSGVIAFFGLAVPHLVRLAIGPSHRTLLPVTALTGAGLLVVADVAARTMAAPAELPLGIVTAGIGAPVMVWLLLRQSRTSGLR